MTTSTISPPPFWSVDNSGIEGLRLTYAVRGGASHLARLLFGIAVLAFDEADPAELPEI